MAQSSLIGHLILKRMPSSSTAPGQQWHHGPPADSSVPQQIWVYGRESTDKFRLSRVANMQNWETTSRDVILLTNQTPDRYLYSPMKTMNKEPLNLPHKSLRACIRIYPHLAKPDLLSGQTPNKYRIFLATRDASPEGCSHLLQMLRTIMRTTH